MIIVKHSAALGQLYRRFDFQRAVPQCELSTLILTEYRQSIQALSTVTDGPYRERSAVVDRCRRVRRAEHSRVLPCVTPDKLTVLSNVYMDEVATMTVPPTLPAKTQPRDASQVARQTVSIRAVSSPPTAPLSTGAGATVFVGLAAPGVDSAATCRRRIPENVGHEAKQENGIACERSSKRDVGVVVSATNLVNEQRCGSAGAGDGCVRISVGSNTFARTSNESNDDSKASRNTVDDLTSAADMVHRDTSEPLNTSTSNSRSSACFYYNTGYPGQLNGMVMSSGQCSPSDTLDSGTCSDLDGTPPPLPKKKNNASTVILASDQHNRTGSLTSSGAEVDSDDNESNISCDSLNGGELLNDVNGNGVEADRTSSSLEYRHEQRTPENHRPKNGISDRPRSSDTETVVTLNRLDSSNEEQTEVESNTSLSVSPSPSGASSLSKASSTPRIRSPDPNIEQNGRLSLSSSSSSSSSSPVVNECTYEERKQKQERLEQESVAGDVDTSVNPVTGKKYVYEYDRFYKFHVNELKGNNKDGSRGGGVVSGDNDTDECFAGYKILEKEAIRSAKGTVRGVKNRVRAGIATFLQKPSSQVRIAKLSGHTASCRIVSRCVEQSGSRFFSFSMQQGREK
ncbi:hypothetical protein E2986_12485 [Frieseomelitta varia]|uniref:Uncharacterized protein n=1 Tax=Frieseomelitta varia TaxID=561572 RepID=A0A833VVL5_9HYME|nr:hypothetical protein E2986_12485 [Frieseomelitta varia]